MSTATDCAQIFAYCKRNFSSQLTVVVRIAVKLDTALISHVSCADNCRYVGHSTDGQCQLCWQLQLCWTQHWWPMSVVLTIAVMLDAALISHVSCADNCRYAGHSTGGQCQLCWQLQLCWTQHWWPMSVVLTIAVMLDAALMANVSCADNCSYVGHSTDGQCQLCWQLQLCWTQHWSPMPVVLTTAAMLDTALMANVSCADNCNYVGHSTDGQCQLCWQLQLCWTQHWWPVPVVLTTAAVLDTSYKW
jgi:hypothetical protein